MKSVRNILCLGAFLFMPLSASAQDDGAYPSSNASTRLETRLSAAEEQMRTLNGRVEQIEFSVRRLEQNLQRMQSDNDARLTKLESEPTPQPPPPAPTVSPQATQTPPPPVDANGTLGALKMQGGKITGAVNNPQSPSLPPTPADYGLSPQEQYEKAFALLRQASYPEAEQAFKNFIEKNPKDKLIDNAKYWYGETLYVRGQFDDAAVAFADAYKQNPQGTKAPDSLLKLGLSLAALNKIPDACVTLNELKSKYPSASPILKTRAEDERTRLKCPAN